MKRPRLIGIQGRKLGKKREHPDIYCNRFDGRALLDFIPRVNKATQVLPQEEKDLMEELNFERYHDLVEAERLEGNCQKEENHCSQPF